MLNGSELVNLSLFARRLASFVVVAETLNFRKAANIIGRSQPAITAQIQQLEEYLGVSLFVRSTRQVRLTVAGADLLDRSKKLLVDTDRLVADFRSHASVDKGQVYVSFAPTVAFGLIPPSLKVFQEHYPNVKVLLREDLGNEMLSAVSGGSIDFGIGPYKSVPGGVSFEPIFEQPFFLIILQDHPLAARGFARPKDLVSLNLVSSSIGTTAREVLDKAARENGLTFDIRYEALQYPTLFSLAAAGLGATVMPAVNPELLKALGLVAIPIRSLRMSRTVGLIRRVGEKLSPAADAFLRTVILTVEQERRHLGLDERG
ncbi:LysR family transcriptional regulator [Orrella marina]|uniref:LysR family transcriptional regulator n=1 Tax=Orrella marina TaxID=2163011 RepID=A0A2R4XGD3_9BURK|nr:LysR family transcriptional regulator [Orrella marina]AWB32789.1 LysR family transcriptional regulator [Orrella marina]